MVRKTIYENKHKRRAAQCKNIKYHIYRQLKYEKYHADIDHETVNIVLLLMGCTFKNLD